MSKYIPFTDAQKQAAKQTDLAAFLESRGESVKRSGSEYEWVGHHITLRGNQYYDQYNQKGGTAVDFVREHFGMSYPDAVQLLLGSQGEAISLAFPPAPRQRQVERLPFALPPANDNMRRVYAYLLKQRCIDRDILYHFAHKGLIYEDAKFHNAVFVGTDPTGVPRHAQKKSTSLQDSSYRGNQAGSDAACSFHHIGTNDTVFVFEAPIDMLSFISLYPDHWQESSYVTLCSVADHALFAQLEAHSNLRSVVLCLDNDTAGRQAVDKILAKLEAKGYTEAFAMISPDPYKDWNEVLQADRGKLVIIPTELNCATLGGMEIQ